MSEDIDLQIVTPEGERHVTLPQGSDASISEVLAQHAITLNTRCGGKGICDSCIVQLLEGRLTKISDGEEIASNGKPQNLRACAYRVADTGHVTIRVPQRAMLAYRPQVVSDFRLNVPLANDPLWHDPQTPPVEKATFGAAIDIGTTTVAVALIDYATGQVVAKASDFNQQMQLGDDVLTRINLCMTDPTKLGELHEAVTAQTITPLIHAALGQAKAKPDQLKCITIAGNSTMLHLLVREDPTPMGIAPFTPRFLNHREVAASELGLPGNADVHLLPGAAAYVGADLTAGVMSSGLYYDDGPSMLVDIGTNGEIILKHEGQLYGCATAAGPAFEGARLVSGMRAGDGAISHIDLATQPRDVRIQVIGNTSPIGLCGTAYVDFLAQGRSIGLLSPAGRFEQGVMDNRLEPVPDYGQAFRVADGPNDLGLWISEADISALLQAKAAIAAGIITLMARVGISASDITTLYLAGGFGMHMDIANAIACGLLPGFSPQQVQLVGNTSLAGAYITQLDRGTLTEMSHLSTKMEIIELNLDPEFEMTYIDQLSLV